MTSEGSHVVDGVVASSYIAFQKGPDNLKNAAMVELKAGFLPGLLLSHHDAAHVALSPFRMWCHGVSSDMCQRVQEDTGMPFYIHYNMESNSSSGRTSQRQFCNLCSFLVGCHSYWWCLVSSLFWGRPWPPVAVVSILGALYAWRRARAIYAVSIRKAKRS